MNINNGLIWLCFVLMVSVTQLAGQRGAYTFNGSRSNGLGGVNSTINSVDALFNNFSNISFDKNSFGASIGSQQRYTLSELSNAQLGVFKKFDENNAFGLSLNTYGFSDYREHKLSLNYARRIIDKLSISVNFDYNQLVISENGQKSFFTYGIGLSGKLTDNIGYGAYIFNFENSSIANQSESNAFIQLGFYNKVTNKLIVHTEVEKFVEETINVKLGLEYAALESIDLRLGFSSFPGALTFGATLNLIDNLSIDVDAQYNTVLGVSPSISLRYLIE
ncbi:hypothetical protein N9L92_01210 [Saprospiraceae bacterium]|nr:hypothetical protein [Saprospiraceae bacterium]